MSKNQTTLTSKRDQWMRYGIVALTIACFLTFAMTAGIMPAFAADIDTSGTDTALENVMGVIVDIITKAAMYIGGAIVLWGVFQIVLAFRREDSEGISKQITTVVVGSILVGFGAFAKKLLGLLGVNLPTE